MGILLFYLMKSLICSGLLTAYYFLFLRDRKFCKFNRFYLLFATAVGLFAPLISVPRIVADTPLLPAVGHFLIVNNSRSGLYGAQENFLWWNRVPLFFYFTVSLVLLILLITRVYKILHLRWKLGGNAHSGYVLIETTCENAPYSFLNYLFWKKDLDQSCELGQMMMLHELVHITQKHSYDKLFLQIATSLFWANPFFWIMQKELSVVHEFLADEKALPNGGAHLLATMLLGAVGRGRYLQPTQSFYHSPIKRRLMMIDKHGQGTPGNLARLGILPLTVALIFLLSFFVGQSQVPTQKNSDSAKIRKLSDEFNAKTYEQFHPTGLPPDSAQVRRIVEGFLQNPAPTRIYYINGVKSSKQQVMKLKYEMLSDVLMLSPEDALKKYGESGEKGIVDFTLKSQAKP